MFMSVKLYCFVSIFIVENHHVDSLSFAGRENRASSTAAAQRLTAGLGMHLGRIFPDQLVGMVEVEFSTL